MFNGKALSVTLVTPGHESFVRCRTLTMALVARGVEVGFVVEMTMNMLSSTLLRRVAFASGRRLRDASDIVQVRTFSSKFNDLEPLQKKENILEVGTGQRSRSVVGIISFCLRWIFVF